MTGIPMRHEALQTNEPSRLSESKSTPIYVRGAAHGRRLYFATKEYMET